MQGKSHIFTGYSAIIIYNEIIDKYKKIFEYNHSLYTFVNIPHTLDLHLKNTNGMNHILFYLIALFCYTFGLLLPDIDNDKSTVGKIAYLPIEHRGISHTIYIPLLFIYMGFMTSNFITYIGIGYLVHIIFDMPSRMGVCLFNPFTGYIKYDSGAKIKKGHFFYIYKNKTLNEYVFVSFICSIAFVILFINLYKMLK